MCSKSHWHGLKFPTRINQLFLPLFTLPKSSCNLTFVLVLELREREAMHRFQNDHAIIHDNIKLIQGLRHPTTDEERGVMEMISEKEATFSGELQSSFFLFRGSEICRFVGKIRLNNGVHGTGFMVSKRLLMTCHHVFNMKASAHCNVGYVKFGTIDPFAGFPRPLKEAEFQLKPGTFYYESEELDLALIAVAKRAVQPAGYHLSNIGHCMAVNDADVTPGQHVNIIQFPSSSDPQKMILRQNQVVQVDEQYVKFLEVEFIQSHQYMASEDEADGPGGVAHQYETFKHVGDTHPGSSGRINLLSVVSIRATLTLADIQFLESMSTKQPGVMWILYKEYICHTCT